MAELARGRVMRMTRSIPVAPPEPRLEPTTKPFELILTGIWFGLADGGRLVAAAAAGPGNSVARDIKLAEMLIARRAAPAPAALADPGVTLKSVLRSPVAG